MNLTARVVPGFGLHEPPLTSRAGVIASGIIGILLAIAAMLSLEPWAVGIVGADPRDFYYVADRFAHGVPPHVSAFYPQNALAMMISGAAIWVGEAVGLDPLVASRIASGTAYALTIALVGILALRLTGDRLIALLSMGAMLTFSWQTLLAATGSQPKTFLALFIVASILATAEDRVPLAGLFSVCAVLVYQAAIVVPMAIAVVQLTQPDRWKRIGRMCIPGMALVAGYEGYFLAQGALGEQVRQAILFPATERGGVWLVDLGLLLDAWRVGAGRMNPLPLIVAAGLAGLAVQLVRRPVRLIRESLASPGWSALLLSFLPLLGFTLAYNQGATDFVIIMPYLAVLGAITAVAGVRALPDVGRLRAGVVGLLVAFGTYVAASDYRRMRWVAADYPLEDQRALAERVGDWIRSGESIFVLGSLYLLGFNHADNWSPFSISFAVRPGQGYYDYVHGAVGFDVSRDGRLPDVIVWARGRPRGWPEWLEARYVEDTPRLFEARSISVWRRRIGG